MQETTTNNGKFWEEVIAYFPFTTYWVFVTTRTAWETPRPTVILILRVYSLQWERVYWASA
jgi:hypothetical protein